MVAALSAAVCARATAILGRLDIVIGSSEKLNEEALPSFWTRSGSRWGDDFPAPAAVGQAHDDARSP